MITTGNAHALRIQAKYSLDTSFSIGQSKVALLHVDFKGIVSSLRHAFYRLKLRERGLKSLNEFCLKPERHPLFKNCTFELDLASFEGIGSTETLEKMFEEGALNGNSIVSRTIQDIEKI